MLIKINYHFYFTEDEKKFRVTSRMLEHLTFLICNIKCFQNHDVMFSCAEKVFLQHTVINRKTCLLLYHFLFVLHVHAVNENRRCCVCLSTRN